MVIGVSGTFSTFAMPPPLIPIPIYFVCPALAIESFVIFHVFFTPVCNGNEQSKHFLHKKTLSMPEGVVRKLFKRQVKSVRIISANPGFLDYRFFSMKKSTKST